MRIRNYTHGCWSIMTLALINVTSYGLSQTCTASFQNNGQAETINFSTSPCNIAGLTQLTINNVSKGDLFVFDADPAATLQEITINFQGSGNNPGIVRINSGVTVTLGSNLNMNQNKGILEVLGVLNVGGSVNASGQNHTFNIDGSMNVGGNFVVGNNSNFNIDGNLFIDGDFNTGNNGTFGGSGVVLVEQNFNPGNNTECTPGQPLCSQFYVRENCNGSAPICNDIIAGFAGLLPVEWLDFTYERSPEGIILNWKTASELNNSHFEIERRSVAYDTSFRKIGETEGSGNSQEVMSYQFLDPRPSAGTNLYRIRQVDFDGTDDYSTTIEVLFDVRELETPVVLYPNPVSGRLNARILPHIQSRMFKLELVNLQGKTILRRELYASNYLQEMGIDVSGISAGMYVYRIMDGIEISRGKLLVK